jgi:hypothetical protein
VQYDRQLIEQLARVYGLSVPSFSAPNQRPSAGGFMTEIEFLTVSDAEHRLDLGPGISAGIRAKILDWAILRLETVYRTESGELLISERDLEVLCELSWRRLAFGNEYKVPVRLSKLQLIGRRYTVA